MRILFPALLAVLAMAPAATAQADGCLQTNPCLLDVEVDEAGIASVSISNLTSGDWFTLAVSNLDDRTHTVSFAGVQVEVEAFGFADSAPFQAPSPGTYSLTDQPTGDAADLRVLAGDVVDAESGSTSSSKGAPGLEAAVLALGLVALAALRRR